MGHLHLHPAHALCACSLICTHRAALLDRSAASHPYPITALASSALVQLRRSPGRNDRLVALVPHAPALEHPCCFRMGRSNGHLVASTRTELLDLASRSLSNRNRTYRHHDSANALYPGAPRPGGAPL